MSSRVPVAWLQLVRERLRLAAAVAGISFAVILMLVQLGFEDALISSASLHFSHMNADLVLVSPQYQYLPGTRNFPERRLYQALAVDDIARVEPLYFSPLAWRNPVTHQERAIFVIAFRPTPGVFALDSVEEAIPKLREENTVLIDALGRPEYGPVEAMLAHGERVQTEVAGRHLECVGVFHLGTSFGIDGNLITSDQTFFRLLPNRSRADVDLGLITLRPGADRERVRERLIQLLGSDVSVLTRETLIEKERHYWSTNTPIGFIFRLGLLMGMFVGGIIVYQILYTDVTDHLGEYATLKAMGYRDRYLFSIVLEESLMLSVFGFIPGLALSKLVYVVAQEATLLPMRMPVGRVAVVYALTLVTCVASGALAMRKLRSADPAEIF
jgi:putative ABC transport system permease protein